jgi:D-galactarolactone isomerase
VRPQPSDQTLLTWALDLFGDEATRRAILVDNPAALYGF